MYIALTAFFGLLFIRYQSLYGATGAWYHLAISSGFLLEMWYLNFHDREFAGLLSWSGSILLTVGLGWTMTFGAGQELERLRSSSWKDIIFGRVPANLLRKKNDNRNATVLSILLLSSGAICLLGGS
ncbi:MAG TPA: hypothetical protein VGH16_13370, partial [Candidatus Binatia bacterium]